MKYFLLLVISFSFYHATAQTPSSFPFQGFLVDESQNAITDRIVDINIFITEDTQGNVISYSESHSTSTDVNGLFNILIGRGTDASGEFELVDWLKTQAFIGIEYDLNDGSGMRMLGYEFIHAVPFALHAKYIISCVDGLNGKDGLQGLQGAQGVQGVSGLFGADGVDGPQGLQGNNGLPIMPILSAVPTTNLQEGLIYLDDGTNRVDSNPGFRYYDGTGWIDL